MEIICSKCSAKNQEGSNFCCNCGAPLHQVNNFAVSNLNTGSDRNKILCPKCGSDNIHFVTIQSSQNFDKSDACCGYLLCGPLGLLCGVKDKTQRKTIRKCMMCNNEF
jgi:hypothetical protein